MAIPTTASQQNPLARAITDLAVITWRNLLHNVRLPVLLLISTIQSVIFMLLFTYIFGGAIELALPPAAAGSYVNWLI
jgi:hypothetical protein